MEVKPGYKQTEVGVIPEDWNVHTLRRCLSGQPDYGINAPAVPYSDKLPAYIRITDITEDGRFSPEKPVSVNRADADRYYLNDGDIVLARTGASVGKSYLYNPNDGKLVFAGFLIRVSPDATKLVPAYLAGYVTTGAYWSWVRLMSMRSGQPGINGKEYGQLPIPLPPTIDEQRAIAGALSDVDALIGALDQHIAKKRDLKQAAMQQLLAGQIRLPGFHGEWEVKPLPEVCLFRGGKAHEQHISEFGRFVCVNSKFISTDGRVRKYSSTNFCPAKRNDILMVMSDLPNGRALAKAFLVEHDDLYAVNQRVCALTPYRDCSKYLFYILNRNPYFLKFDDGVSQTHLLNHVFWNCPLPIPPTVAEQTAIAEVLSDMDAELAALEQRRDKTRALKQGMMQELLTGRTRLVDKRRGDE